MEWKTAERAKVGQHRERLKFAWLPTECADGKTRWLCKIRVLECLNSEWDGFTMPRQKWVTIRTYRAEVER